MANFIRVNIPGPAPVVPAEDAAIDAALVTWGQTLLDNINVSVGIGKIAMPPPHNAISIPNLFENNGHMYSKALAKALNIDIPVGMNAMDIMLWFDSNTAWVTAGNNINANQFDLETTVLHEICHGLGFHGLCNVSGGPPPNLGHYSPLSLIAAAGPLNVFAVYMNANLVGGQLTPFANLFNYNGQAQGQGLVKGTAADDFQAFLGDTIIELPSQGQDYKVYTPNAGFRIFTSCDHIDYPGSLMYYTTQGSIIRVPDVRTTNILRTLGWNI